MAEPNQPNIVFIMSDDHAAHAISAYGSRINQTPGIDRIANEGMRLDHCYCTNSICTPSRATILTGQHGHVNGVKTLDDDIDGRKDNLLQKLLKRAGYQTAIVGKWHLGHGGNADPTGFDYWNVLPGQGAYHDPKMYEMGQQKTFPGYTSEIITDQSLKWLDQRDTDKPFFLCCHHKAPHRPWSPGENYKHLFENEDVPEPETLFDDYSNRAQAAEVAKMRMEDLNDKDLKQPVPEGMSYDEEHRWRYQRYIKDYLRCCASVDDSVSQLLNYLDANALTENTIIIYTSDQGFFLGDHGWFDKRFMYEQSLQMPFVIRYPHQIEAASVCDEILTNNDFAPTLLDYAGVDIPDEMQGVSGRPILDGKTPDDWQQSLYYRYWMHGSIHQTAAHYGVRTKRYKLIYYYSDPMGCRGATDEPVLNPEWELFDLEDDPQEMMNRYHDPNYASIVTQLTTELNRLQQQANDKPRHEVPA